MSVHFWRECGQGTVSDVLVVGNVGIVVVLLEIGLVLIKTLFYRIEVFRGRVHQKAGQ